MAKSEKIKIIGISGSPRNKNTNYMLKTVLDATGCLYELILLKDKNIKPCLACGGCFHSHKCVVNDDMQDLYGKMLDSDIIIFGCPTYFANVTALMKNFMDRCLPLYLSEGLKDKKAALLAVGNFKKGEVRFLDNFDAGKAMQTLAGRKILEEPVKKCLDIMNFFCTQHMGMKIVGSVLAINGNSQSKEKELINLGEKLISRENK
jgi:multimeric flavodoxin WrbA